MSKHLERMSSSECYIMKLVKFHTHKHMEIRQEGKVKKIYKKSLKGAKHTDNIYKRNEADTTQLTAAL